MSLDDLESKLFSEPAPKAARKPAPVKKEKAAPKKKEEAPVAVPPPAPAPTKKERASKTKYVELPPAPAPVKAPKAAPVKAERKPREEKPRPAPVAKTAVAAAEKDPNASTLGVALGAAPLLVAPLVALAGARGALSKTQARRAQIQKEIEEKAKEAARKRVERSADADGGGSASAFGSLVFLSFDEFFVVVEFVQYCMEQCLFIV
jgi:hypothetical protein